MSIGGSLTGQEAFAARSRGFLPANSPTPWLLTKGLIATSNPMLNPILNKSPLVLIFTLLAVAILAGAALSALTGTGNRFSSKQVESYMQIVGSELGQPRNWTTDTGVFSVGKTSCYPVALGEGKRNGVPGLYTWFTCSGIRPLVLTDVGKSDLPCTGFSLPVWIAPSGKSVNYEAASSASAYAALRTEAPARIQNLMDRNYNLVNQHSANQIVGRAAPGAQPRDVIGNQPACP